MRCACPHCEAFMIQSETEAMACICPECGYKCNACLGTNTVISKEQLDQLKSTEWFTPQFDGIRNDEEAAESEEPYERF